MRGWHYASFLFSAKGITAINLKQIPLVLV